MNSSFFRVNSYSFSFLFILIILVSILIIPIYSIYPQAFKEYTDIFVLDDDAKFVWPIPGYMRNYISIW